MRTGSNISLPLTETVNADKRVPNELNPTVPKRTRINNSYQLLSSIPNKIITEGININCVIIKKNVFANILPKNNAPRSTGEVNSPPKQSDSDSCKNDFPNPSTAVKRNTTQKNFKH